VRRALLQQFQSAWILHTTILERDDHLYCDGWAANNCLHVSHPQEAFSLSGARNIQQTSLHKAIKTAFSHVL
jgi:hypothetical protein